MKKYSSGCYIYLTGSRITVTRTVYQDIDGKLYIKWYGEYIEVSRGAFEYKTVELY